MNPPTPGEIEKLRIRADKKKSSESLITESDKVLYQYSSKNPYGNIKKMKK